MMHMTVWACCTHANALRKRSILSQGWEPRVLWISIGQRCCVLFVCNEIHGVHDSTQHVVHVRHVLPCVIQPTWGGCAGGCVFFSALELSKQRWREVLGVPTPPGESLH